MAVSAWGQTGADAPKSTNDSVLRPSVTFRQLQIPSADQLNKSDTHLYLSGDMEQLVRQQGCPVQIIDASFQRQAEIMLTASTGGNRPSLHLRYLNSSGKNIESVTLRGWIKTKASIYQLDYDLSSIQLKLSRKALPGSGVEATEALSLAANALGLDRIELEQVRYTNGSTWNRGRQTCVFEANGESLRVAK
jgi:hypothetical protein